MNPKRLMGTYDVRRQDLTVLDSGINSGTDNMAVDRMALSDLENNPNQFPTLRFFQWEKDSVSYGYLLNEQAALRWADGYPTVQRPTGGGAVHHKSTDLSLSILWSKSTSAFPLAPRECYAAIHEYLRIGIQTFIKHTPIERHSKPAENCEIPGERKIFNVCFELPVCNDLMMNGKKVAGGALRITKFGTLYQGTIQLQNPDIAGLKKSILSSFRENFRINHLQTKKPSPSLH